MSQADLFRYQVRERIRIVGAFRSNSTPVKPIDEKFFPPLIMVSDPVARWWSIVTIGGILQDVAPSRFDVSSLKPLLFVTESRTKSISGKKMRQRAVELGGNLGLADGKRMLAEQYKIPAKFRDYYIPLPGTLLCSPKSDLVSAQENKYSGYVIAYLSYEEDSWIMGLHGYDCDWPDNGRLAVYKK
ncbi:MAG: hypothetical protein G01um101413_157 [Parcubacteria group bacterium Gr01-1014_13]|nr:MAG: hypothetical protein G01um101413_157 [Parcubacteria group bacterium Gr01-1014_13]